MDEMRRKRRFVPPAAGVSRRAVARGVLSGGLVAALQATAGRRDARAQATAAAVGADETGPRRYVLKGGESEIVFVPAAADDAARLDYRDATGSLSFAGDALDTARNEALGPLAAVLLEAVPDGFVRYLTVLVPEVNRDEDRPDVPIRTLAILTTHVTNIGGPAMVKGALQTYEVVALDGVAEFAPA